AEGSGAGAGGAPGVAGGGAGEAVGAEAGADVHPGEAGQAPLASVRRRVRINGQPKRPLELLGHLNVVLFSPEDVELIGGPAALRRRYLDITLCQVDRLYLHALSRYQRVLQQRNALLKEARERTVRQDQFDYWDTQLADLGGSIVAARLRAVGQWNASLAAIYPRLVNDGAGLRAAYRSSIPLGDEAPALEGQEPARAAARLRERFVEQLAAGRVRERQQAVTLVGPHRDDIGFFAGEVDLRTYGSRGQQRVAALSLKLAEVEVMQQYTTERPVLLLDDVLSELDPRRRRYLQGVVRERPDQQVLMTATELTSFADDFLQDTEIHHVAAGKITRARE
ncbi:MAG TPA: DNA replication and repair protein RecF, partial [Chloroflexota bacterium]|nr:DNA replication and repair protein RecF [Chloroflexota bacterium]